MTYTIKKLAELAGISTRTLRYYDEIHLLTPRRLPDSEYRIYSEYEVDRLQLILFYREMGLELSEIKLILDAESFEKIAALKSHLAELEKKRRRLDLLIDNVTKSIQKEEGTNQMTDQEKFKGFKEALIQKNEEAYGEEIRRKYGDKTVEESNATMRNLSEEAYHQIESLGAEINKCLQEAVAAKSAPTGEDGIKIANLHKQWLMLSMPNYTAEIHKGLVEMYLADKRFKAYYDKETSGCAQFLHDAVLAHM